MLNYAVFGLNAFGYHLFQVIFHILNGILIFKVLSLLTQDVKNKFINLINLLAVTIFIVHPAINEAVVYIAALSEVMYTFFILLGIYWLIRTIKDAPGIKQLIIPNIFFFSALLFKESAVTFIPIVFIILFFVNAKFWKKWALSVTLTGLVYFFIRLVLVKTPIRHPEFAPISEASFPTRLMTVPAELAHYLKITVFPSDLAISQHFLVTSLASVEFIISSLVALMFIITAAFFAFKTKLKLAWIGIFWFLIGFSLISNIFPLDMTVAERWLYFPFIGLVFLLSAFLTYISSRKSLFRGFVALFLAGILALSIRTVVRNTNWADGLNLYSHDINISKNSFDLENNLGVELFRQGQYSQAKTHFENSINLQPKWYFSYNNLGAVYQQEGNWQKAEQLYKKTLSLSDYYLAYENLAQLYTAHEPPEQAKEFITNSLKKLPNNPKLWLYLSLTDYKLGNKQDALLEARQSYLISPSQDSYLIYTRLKQGLPLDLQ